MIVQLNFDISNTDTLNGYFKVISNSQPLFFSVFYPLYLEFLDILKFINSLI